MALSVNITISMPPEKVEKIDEHRGNWSRSRYIRHAIDQCDGTPFDVPEGELPNFEDLQTNEAGGAA